MIRRRRGGRRPARWPIALLVVAFVGVGLGALFGNPFDSEPGPVEITDPPTTYRIVYRVEELAGAETVVNTERVWVQRPFRARVETARGEPPGGEVLSVTIHDFARTETQAGELDTRITTTEVAPPPVDLRFDAVLDEALGAELVERLGERRTAAGRACELYRAPGEAPGSFRNRCVDEAGLVVLEEETSEGRLLRRRTAVDVALEPALDDGLFDFVGTPLHIDAGGGNVAEVTPESRFPETTSYELPDPPEGLERLGRFVHSPADPGPDPILGTPIPTIASVVDVWASGAEFLVVDNLTTLNRKDPFEGDTSGRLVTVEALGVGRLRTTLWYHEVRVTVERGQFLRVRGTLAATELLRIARSLEPVVGGEIRVL